MNRSPKPTTVEEPFSVLEALLTAAVSLLLVWRLLSPTEGASLGYGLWAAQFTFVTLVLWAVCCWRRGAFQLQFCKIDIAVALLVTGHLFSGFLALRGAADQRATINLLCEWAALAATYFLMRQTFRTGEIRRQIIVIMLAVTTALAGYGFWQHYVWYPSMAAEYNLVRGELDQVLGQPASTSRNSRVRQLQQQLLAIGVPQSSLEGRGRESYEGRLLASTEPLGRFALANTFAGLLVTWLVVLTAILVYRWQDPGNSFPTTAVWAMGLGLVLLIAFCLLLTKSRTAYVGALAGLAVIALSMIRARKSNTRRTLLILCSVVVATGGLVGLAAATGGLDRWVVAEAPKSLRYRLEYWQGTWDVIREHPLFGVGPGNFRNHYLQYKLPESSEEISDPHNLVLDVWVNGGILALTGLGLLGAFCLTNMFRKADSETTIEILKQQTPPQRTLVSHAENTSGRILIPIPAATTWGASTILILVSMLDMSVAMWGVTVAWCLAMPVCDRVVGRSPQKSMIFLAGLVALSVHLLGAGGIAMPAISQTLLLLVALLIPIPPQEAQMSKRSAPLGLSLAASVISLGLCIACWYYATRPVFLRDAAMAEVNEMQLHPGNAELARRSFLAAAQSDPYSAAPWRKIAELEFGLWLTEKTNDIEPLRTATKMLQKSLEKNPRSWRDFRTLGEYHFQEFLRSHDQQAIVDAVSSLRQAVKLYPNQIETKARLAEALKAAGQIEEAHQEAAEALRLNEITEQAGHQDRVLPEKTRELLEEMVNQGSAATSHEGRN